MTTSTDWLAANRATLQEALLRVHARLQAHTERGGSPVSPPVEPPPAAPPAPGTALGLLQAIFGLTPFETDLLVLCAGVEFEASLPLLCAAAAGDPTRLEPTFSLALAALDGPHWSALTPDAPLRRWQLISVSPAALLTQAILRIDEPVLHFLTGLDAPDTRLAGRVAPAPAGANPLPPRHESAASRLAQLWTDDDSRIVRARGARPPAVEVAARAAALGGGTARLLDIADLPPDAAEREVFCTLVDRQTLLGGGPLVILVGPSEPPAGLARLAQLQGPIAIIGDAAGAMPGAVALDIAPLPPDEQADVWQASLTEPPTPAVIDDLVSQFSLTTDAIRSAATQANHAGLSAWTAAREQARQGLDGLATHIDAHAGWDDLVLPSSAMALLHQIEAQVRHRHTVLSTWGLDRGSSLRGAGVSALFAGASGTGKTLAAEVLAGALDLDLFRVDLSQVVSKYIGETEKNLGRVFDAADAGGCVLLFDEADALFGKRGEVKDSHDRYANLEVSYLLQRMEAYRGLAVLTTNLRGSLDKAFLRRLQFVITFSSPDAAERELIWRRTMPAALPTEGLRLEALAQLAVPGGSIRNIVVAAAFAAAAAGTPVRMAHLLAATEQECTKLERPLAPTEVGGWV